MGLKIKRKPKSTIPPLEAGTYTATCVGVIDLGEQRNEKFNKYEDKILLIFEIANEHVEQDGEKKPRWLSRDLTASISEKSNMYKYITGFIGQFDDNAEEFDPSMLLGKTAFLQVSVEKSKSSPDVMYNDIVSITQLPKGMKPPAPESSIMLLDFDDFDDKVFSELPEWIQNKIRNSPTYQKMGKPPEKVEFTDDSGNNENAICTATGVALAMEPDKADF